jgi:very-short-patch-repair endonuclease
VPTVKAVLEEQLSTMAEAGWTAGEIASYLNCSPQTIQRYARELKIQLKREKSYGALGLRQLLLSAFTGYKIEEEYGIGNRLRLDFFVPELKIAFEFDGSQHTEFSEHFHGDEDSFRDAQKRDRNKDEYCALNGIKLVRVTKGSDLSVDDLLQAALQRFDTDAPYQGSHLEEPEPPKRGNRAQVLYAAHYKELARKRRQANYRQQKERLQSAKTRAASSAY